MKILRHYYSKEKIMKYTLLILGFGLFFISCDKDIDETPPVIENMTIDGEADEIYLPIESTFEITALINKLGGEGQMKLDIHSNFDGHGHKNNLVDYSHVEIYDIEGESYTFTDNRTIPDSVKAGPYHVGLFAIDEAGNESNEAIMELIVTRLDAPQVNITAPNFSNDLSYAPGDTIHLEGIVADDESLVEVIVSLKEINGEGEAYNKDFDLTGNPQSWDFQTDGNLNIAIESGLPAGKYSLLIRAEDNLGNITLHREQLNLTN